MTETCPVCGYLELRDPPWSDGLPSDEICPQCGTHFGYDDAVGLRDQAALPARHQELRDRWTAAGSRWWSKSTPAPSGASSARAAALAGIPAHLRSDGPFASVLPKRQPVTAELFTRFKAYQVQNERLLSAEHLAAIDSWLIDQPDSEPDTSAIRGPYLNVYLRQVTASTVVERDVTGVERLAKAAFVMGAWIEQPQETSWRHLRFAAQAAAGCGEDPFSLLSSIVAGFGPVSARVLESRWRFIERMAALPITLHQPSGLPLVESPWDAEHNAKRLGLTAWRLDRPLDTFDPPWPMPAEPLIRAVTPGSATANRADAGHAFVEPLNRYLISGAEADLKPVLESAEARPLAQQWAAWAVRFWHGDAARTQHPELTSQSMAGATEGTPGGDLIAVARGGTAQVTSTVT